MGMASGLQIMWKGVFLGRMKTAVNMPPELMIAWGIANLPELIKLKQILDARDNVQKLITEGQTLLGRKE